MYNQKTPRHSWDGKGWLFALVKMFMFMREHNSLEPFTVPSLLALKNDLSLMKIKFWNSSRLCSNFMPLLHSSLSYHDTRRNSYLVPDITATMKVWKAENACAMCWLTAYPPWRNDKLSQYTSASIVFPSTGKLYWSSVNVSTFSRELYTLLPYPNGRP